MIGATLFEVPLVVLQDVGNLVDRDVLLGEVFREIAKTFDVFLHFFPLRIGHENDSIDAAQDELAGRIVDDLARDGVELEFRDEAFDHDRVQGQEIEEQRAVGGGRK